MSSESAPAEQKPLAPGLYLVATPIGNLEDITLRALRVLRSADRIACEDTRQTRKLLNHFGIETPALSLHEHNEAARAAALIEDLRAGARIAVVSDAGIPGISDPGSLLVKAAIEAGVAVVPVPGANAALSALIASGLNTEEFLFLGFLAPKTSARRARLQAGAAKLEGSLTLVLYEAPHRILEMLADVESVYGPECRVVLARELTKVHEEFLRGSVSEVRAQLAGRDRIRGEMVLLIEARPRTEGQEHPATLRERVDELARAEGLDEKEALKRIARERGVSKSELYRELQLQRGRKRP
jgi:16S rRNA (cytidine1402-2'-O)-methyltransferase